MKRIVLILVSSLFAFSLAGCVPPLNSCNYHYCEVGRVNCVKSGVVICRRQVVVGANTGTGTFAGTLLGAAAGSNIGGCGSAGLFGTLAGALVGGVVGNAIEQDANRQPAYEYLIRMDDGNTISVLQGCDVRIRVHERVVVKLGRFTRVIPECVYFDRRF